MRERKYRKTTGQVSYIRSSVEEGKKVGVRKKVEERPRFHFFAAAGAAAVAPSAPAAPAAVFSWSTNIDDTSIVATVRPWNATRARIIRCETFWLPCWSGFFFVEEVEVEKVFSFFFFSLSLSLLQRNTHLSERDQSRDEYPRGGCRSCDLFFCFCG